MSRIPTITEQELGNLQPTGLDEDFLARLTACAEETQLELSEDELAFESRLRAIRPRTIPSALQSSLLDVLGDTPFSVDEKIVLFNKSSSATVMAGKKWSAFRFNIVAAAAVALLGSLAAFMVPGEIRNVEKSVTSNVSASFPAPLTPAPELVAPASFNPNPSVTQDQGAIWRGKNQPNRVLSRTYMDQVLSKDADGNPIIELRPRVEYEITPEKID